MTKPEPIVIDLADGSTLKAMIHVESGKLHLNTGWFGTFVLNPESVTQVCLRILQLLRGEMARG